MSKVRHGSWKFKCIQTKGNDDKGKVVLRHATRAAMCTFTLHRRSSVRLCSCGTARRKVCPDMMHCPPEGRLVSASVRSTMGPL